MENQERFYEWMLKMGNIHLADNQQMSKAFEIVGQKSNKTVRKHSLIELYEMYTKGTLTLELLENN